MKISSISASTYLDTLVLLRRLNRHFMDTLKIVIQSHNWRELTPAQLMMIYQVGQGPLKISDIFDRGFCEGVNPSYNIKKMVSLNYLEFLKTHPDKRVTTVALGPKGWHIYQILDQVLRWQEEVLAQEGWHASRWRGWQREIRGLFRLLKTYPAHTYVPGTSSDSGNSGF